jgi:hypothetical protein
MPGNKQLSETGFCLSFCPFNLTGRYRNRTYDPLIKSQRIQNDKSNQNKDLTKAQNCTYKPAYKNNPETVENQAKNLPADLAEVIAVWPGLPVHIKAAIKALIETSKSETKRE